MAITLDGTNGITTPDLDSSGPVTGTTGTFSGAVQASGVATNLYPLVLGTAVASTSGTSIDFTGIPSWVKRITVVFNGVSTNGASHYLLQLGDSGGIETTGYTSNSITTNNASGTAGTDSTAGYAWFNSSSTFVQSGMFIVTNVSGNTWVSMHQGYLQNANDVNGGGTKTLSNTLDRVRITTVNGTDTFDAGSINILYE